MKVDMRSLNNTIDNTTIYEDLNAMDVTQLMFNKLIGLELALESGLLVSIPEDPKYTNHLGTIHASAILAVAEAGSGEFLSQNFVGYTGAIPVVRLIEAKFRKTGVGKISARCMATPEDVAHWRNELAARGRVLAALPMEVIDAGGAIVLTATVEWFVTLNTIISGKI